MREAHGGGVAATRASLTGRWLARARRWRTGPLWRQPDFVRFWVAQTVSVAGSQVSHVALPLTAVLWLEATAFQMGVLRALGAAPVLLLALFAGVWVDRLPRRPILVAGDAGRAVLLAAVPLAAVLGLLRLEVLYAVALLAGALTVFYDVASTSYLPALVRRERLVEANGTLQVSGSAAGIVGPGLAGGLVQAVGAPFAVVLDALSFLASAALLAGLRADPRPPPAPVRAGIWGEIGEGLRLLWYDPVLRPLTLATTVGAFAGSVQGAVWVLFAVREVGASPALLGAVFATGGAAALAGAAVAGAAARRLGPGRALLGAVAVMTCGGALVPAAGLGDPGTSASAVPLLMVSQVLWSGGMSLFSVIQISLRQAITPFALLGRINATRRLLVFGVAPMGALVGGAVGTAFGLRAALLVAAAVELLALLVAAASPLRTLGATSLPGQADPDSDPEEESARGRPASAEEPESALSARARPKESA